jgi:predicted O-linked N-acetylglucosamine transferase (SPINDLY family)
VGASLLNAVGLPQLIVPDEAAYCELAIELGRSEEKRKLLRIELREKRLRSALFDSPRFVRNLESLYQQMWNRRQ